MGNENTVVKATLTGEQTKALDELIGFLGSNRQDVVGKIITMWLYNEGHIKPKRK